MQIEQKLVEAIERTLRSGSREFVLRGAELDVVATVLKAALTKGERK
jgi:hypothetical protein